jgi:predicted CoA-binding protein
MNVKDSEIKDIMAKYKKITVFGLSPDAAKPSQAIPRFMRSKGYNVVGLYPGEKEIEGFKIYQDLREVPAEQRKFVDVFRRPEHIPAVVEEVLSAGGVEVLWLQLGITNKEAEARAEAAGLKVISDRCWLIEYRKYFG